MEALAARIDAMKALLREALRCGCVELDACGKLFRSRPVIGGKRGVAKGRR